MSNSVKKIYCISGLGADERAFERLNVNGCFLEHLSWISPLENEDLSSYAGRMLDQVKEENPIILGLSFGGMIAIEMAKKITIEKLILISTVKTSGEIPGWMRVAGRLNLHKLIPIKMNRFTEKVDDRRIGIETAEEKNLLMSTGKKQIQNISTGQLTRSSTGKAIGYLPMHFIFMAKMTACFQSGIFSRPILSKKEHTL